MSPRHLQARDLLVRVDRSERAGFARQLEEQLRDAIRAGTLAGGSDLPSTRALAEELAVSRGVVVRAYAQLASEGYLALRQGANPRVREIPQLEPTEVPECASDGRPKARYDLRAHLPELSAFPRQAWLRSLRQAVTSARDADLGYVSRYGLEPLRVEISHYLGRARGVAADPRRIVVTTGSTHTLGLIARALGKQGARRFGFENPSHHMLHAVARSAGQTPIGVAVDESGLCVEHLPAAKVDAVLVSPAHQFPTGVALSADRRGALIAWARATGGLIVEDEYDAEFRYDRAPIGALQGLSPEEVAYLGSTGKTLAPGIRIGWAVLPRRLVEPVGDEVWSSMLHVSGIDQLALADFMRRGEFDRHLRRMRAIYRRRRDALVAALKTHFPYLSFGGISAGLHVVVELESPEAEAAICRHAQTLGLVVESLSEHALPGYEGPPGLLIGYGNISEQAIPFAVDLLAQAFRLARQPGSGRATGSRAGRSRRRRRAVLATAL